MRRLHLCVVILLRIALLGSCKKDPDYNFVFSTPASGDGKTYTAKEIAGFMQMMSDGATPVKVKKWARDTVEVYLSDTTNSLLNAELPVIFDDIKTASGNRLVFRRSTDSLAPLKIYFTGKAAFLQRYPSLAPQLTGANDERTGYCYIWWNSDYRIYQSVIFLDKEKLETVAVQLRYLARHEMTHALGYLTHVSLNDFPDSVMYYINNSAIRFSAFDRNMIALLYNPAMTVGLTGEALNSLLLAL